MLKSLAVAAVSALAAFAAAPLALAADAPPAAGGQTLVYFGTYTGKVSKGIYVSRLDAATGKLSAPELAGEVTNPSFIAIHPSKKFLLAAGEVSEFNGKKAGAISSFSIDPATGKLTLINQQASGGQGPCFVTTNKAGTHALAANYGSGSVAALPIGADGKLGEASATVQHVGSSVNPGRQKGPHAHSINLSPDGRFALAADLGLDKVLVYKFDQSAGTLTPNDPPAGVVKPGSGPRHLAWHPDGKHAFVINEMANTLTGFKWDANKGVLTEFATVPTLPADAKAGSSTAEVVVHPSGKFVYGSNRGHDSIAAFAFDAATEKLTPAGHAPTGGKTPRNFNIDPTGNYLIAANQGTGNVTVFKIDQATGGLTAVGEPLAVPSPVCVKFLQP